MKQEDKELLLKDLCARLPYGVKGAIFNKDLGFEGKYSFVIDGITQEGDDIDVWLEHGNFSLETVKPYLFLLSSMTDEQQEEFDRIYADDMQVVANNLKNRLDGKPCETNLGHYRHIDWLNANHFDYRGLISKGLAIDATGLNIY